MVEFPVLTNTELIRRLELPGEGLLPVVLDTDTYNEVDDQFALAYALLSKERLRVEAIYAAPFLNERSSSPQDGMEQSYQEILRLLGRMDMESKDLVFKGSDQFLPGNGTFVESAAASDLVRRAADHSQEDPLYVVAIGAITNIASAILMDPGIIHKIIVVWLGGNPLHWFTAREFNLSGDVIASQLIFDCGVPLIQIPCMGVASHLLTTVAELDQHLKGRNPLCNTLIELFSAYTNDHFAWGKEIWDVAAIAYLINPDWVPSGIVHSPVLNDNHTWSTDTRRHFIRSAYFVFRNPVFRDLFSKLQSV